MCRSTALTRCLDQRTDIRHPDPVGIRDFLRWRPRTRWQVVADRFVNIALAWLAVGVLVAVGGNAGRLVSLGVIWTVMMLVVGIPLGLRQLQRRD